MIEDFLGQIYNVLGGAIGTGVIWLAKAMWRAQKDLNYAHEKIRDLEETVEKLTFKE